tara:strand:+ start:371 stop:763 length:393 start_codon:yes stop_codon:yes gene_type:complete
MAAIKIKLNVESAGLLSSPIKLLESDSIVTTGVVQRIAKTITAVNGSSVVLLAKADFSDSDDQVLAVVKNTGGTHDLILEAGANVEIIKLKPGQFAMFPWYHDDSDGQDLKAYASNSDGTTVEATAIEIT